MGNNGGQVEFTPVTTGDMGEIPPDLPAGTWQATCSVKKAKTNKDSFPMLILEWKTTEALTEGNEDHVGGKAADFLTFFPGSHRASRMSKLRLKGMCAALNIDVPSATQLKTWNDVADFIEALDGLQAVIYTSVEERKDTGEQTTKIRYTAPGGLSASSQQDDDEDEDEEEEAPKKAPLKKKKRSN